jgi:hypothetical protein
LKKKIDEIKKRIFQSGSKRETSSLSGSDSKASSIESLSNSNESFEEETPTKKHQSEKYYREYFSNYQDVKISYIQ